MKRKISLMVGIATLVVALTGCGGEQNSTSGRNDVVSGGAVSGSVITCEGKETTEVESEYYPCYYTDTNYYWGKYTEDALFCYEYGLLDGTKDKKVEVDGEFWEMLTVVGDYVYYLTMSSDDDNVENMSISRMPIQKKKNGNDIVLAKEEEKLVEEDCPTGEREIEAVFVGNKHLLYKMKGKDKLTKLDLNTKEKSYVEAPIENIGDVKVTFLGYGDMVLAEVDGHGLFIAEGEWSKWTQLTGYNVSGYTDCVAWNQESYYYASFVEGGKVEKVHKCDFATKTEGDFVSQDELRQALIQSQKLESGQKRLEDYSITELFWDEGRLYLQVQVNWMEDKTYHMAYVVFSKGSEESTLQYEKELTEWMWKKGGERNGRWVLFSNGYKGSSTLFPKTKEIVIQDKVKIYPGKCYEIVNGKAYEGRYGDYYFDQKDSKGKKVNLAASTECMVYGRSRNSVYLSQRDVIWGPKIDEEIEKTYVLHDGGFVEENRKGQ